MRLLFELYPLLLLLARTEAAGIGQAWQVSPYTTDYWNQPSWPRSDSSAFEIRTVSGFGHSNPPEPSRRSISLDEIEPNTVSNKNSHLHFESTYENPSTNHRMDLHESEDSTIEDKFINAGIMMTILQPNDKEIPEERKKVASRLRRDAENETNLEQISSNTNVREVRFGSPDSWSSQPLSVEIPRRSSLDQMIQMDDEELANTRSYPAPRADFVTSHHRRSYEHREARDMPVTRAYDDYDYSWYRNAVRDRDYDPLTYRRGLGYYYPDRYRTDRDYYTRLPSDYYYDRYRDEDLDLYGRTRPTPKPKRIIYYATLPEIVRKPVDLRNYPRTYDGTRTPTSRDGTYKRVPGNVDPSRYRYRQPYDSYDSYTKRSSILDRPYPYPEEDSRRKVTLENLRNNEQLDQNNERKIVGQMKNDGKLSWPVQIGTEVNVKDDERIPGRKIFGESNGYERFQSAQLQKAPDATGSSELQSDN